MSKYTITTLLLRPTNLALIGWDDDDEGGGAGDY
jgi:hypothetical protein